MEFTYFDSTVPKCSQHFKLAAAINNIINKFLNVMTLLLETKNSTGIMLEAWGQDGAGVLEKT
jgi:hypothetical protein